MTTKSQSNNNVIYSIKSRATSIKPVNQKPSNVAVGGTTGGVNNYGNSRGGVVGSYSKAQLLPFKAGKGTTQERRATTRLPGDF